MGILSEVLQVLQFKALSSEKLTVLVSEKLPELRIRSIS
jgi:hypothetical protein